MKTKVIITAGLLIAASGIVSADPFDDEFFSGEDMFNDGFFNEEPQAPDDGSEDDSASDDPFNSDDWFNDDWFNDDFFNEEPETPDAPEDDSGEENENNTEDEYGVCVIGEDSPCNGDENDSETPPVNDTPEEPVNDTPEDGDSEVTEEAYIEEAPEPGDTYYEAGTDDWVSYVNPRDDYHPERSGRDQYPGSGKVCIALLNEDGEPIAGETVPDTQVSMETRGMEWHSYANPFTVEYPVTENYDRPLDSDQFGTSSDVPQGDGYMDSHCLEAHLLENTDTIEYDEVEITGQHADDIEVVGYYDQLNTWDSDFDPENDVSPYNSSESSDGSVTMSPGNSHFEILAVLQLDR